MRHREHEPAHPQQILSIERIGTAVRCLTDPNGRQPGDPLRLTAAERDTIGRVISVSAHPFAALTEDLLNQWGQLNADERAADLLLLANLIHPHPPTPRPHHGPTLRRGIER